MQHVEMHATHAKTPQLNAVKRHRPVNALNQEARERLELEEMKKRQFKAHPIDDKIFKAPVLPQKKECKATKVEPFRLTEAKKEVRRLFGGGGGF